MGKYSSYVLFLLISIFVVMLYINNFGPLNDLQRSITDKLCRFTAQEGIKPNVVLVTIDGVALDEYGPWPWNNDLIADLVAAVGTGEPKTIALDFELKEDSYQDSAGYTSILAEQLDWVQNVVLPYDIALATYRTGKTNNPRHLYDNSVQVNNPVGLMNERSSLLVRKVFLPADRLLQNQRLLGFHYIMPDDDRVLRHQSLIMNYEGFYYPSLSLLAAASYLDVKPDQIKVIEGKEIQLGSKVTVPINSGGNMFVNFAQDFSFISYSASLILSEGFNLNSLKGKLVLITVDDISFTEQFHTPINSETPRFVFKATVMENIVNNNLLSRRNDLAGLTMLLLFVIGGVCAFALPQVSLLFRMLILAGIMIVFANINYFMINSFKMIVDTIYFYLEIVLFMAAAPMLDSKLLSGEDSSTAKALDQKLPKIEIGKTIEAKNIPIREIKESRNDPANQPTTAIGTSDNFPEDHQTLHLDEDLTETKAEPLASGTGHIDTKALSADQSGAKAKTATDDGERKKLFEDAPAAGTGDSKSDFSITPTSGALKKMGRYQITGTLGKGAMGHVYMGIDPAINRPLALKTIRLDFINDPEEMEELKERLHREAQAAGKLSHPNIVTIYDVGSEGTMAYIAMEYLEGQTLEDLIKKKTKFNYKIIAQIIIQICSALQYAHDQNIVHRDIKPANIMITKDYQVKVMDFGIARVESSSMTKTGIAMGTPNYISPEQLQGGEVDRRADLFSLGVVMYELLIGKRPFKGENITSLIYSILHSEPEKPSIIMPQIPLLFDHVVEKALKKKPQDRYQSASEIMTDMSEFIAAFATKS